MKPIFYINALLFIVLASSCGDEANPGFDINAEPIDTYLENEQLKDRPHLKIKNSAFSRDFLFYGTFIPMLDSPTGHSLKGRIIRFQIFADRVVMLESPKGHSIANENDSLILLAEFPIVQVEGDGVVIDFAKGMISAFTTRNVHSRSVSEQGSHTGEQFQAIFLTASFVRSINAEDDVMTISQIAQWRNQRSELISAEFRYFFREYLPSFTFKKSTFGKQRWVQYFSTPPLVQPPTTEAFAYITKWDVTNPLVFYISSNTPKNYRKPIKDGLLFWNHIFGKNVVEVRDLEEGISAPHPRFNIVQWVPWDNEASAYADMVVDHLTGETLQAQIYLRSGWVIQSAKKLRNQLEELLLADLPVAGIQAIEENVPLPSMFDFDNPCFKTMANLDEIADLAVGLSSTNISNQTLTLLTSDIIRAVIAHEMGHVFGLRHNLASSTFGNISLSERSDLLKRYLASGDYEFDHDKYISRSIMDVFSAADDAMVGAQIRELIDSENISSSRLKTIYDYDKQAIEFGYFGKPMLGNTAFCTDDDIPRYLDCRRWDVSNTPALFSASRLRNMMTQVAMVLADTFVAIIDPERKGGPMSITDLPLTDRGVLKALDQYVKDLFLWFNQNTRSVQIETSFPAFGPQNQKEITAAKFKSLREQVGIKGVDQTLFALLPPFRPQSLDPDSLVQSFSAHLTKRISDLQRLRPTLSFSALDLEETQQIARGYFESINGDVINLVANIISHAHFDDPDFQIPIEEALGKIARELILANDADNGSAAHNGLPKFHYALKTRDAGAQLLNPALGLLSDWSFENLRTVTNDLKLLMRRYGATEGATTIDLNSLSREQRQWLLDQNRILNTLMQIKTMARVLNPPTPGN